MFLLAPLLRFSKTFQTFHACREIRENPPLHFQTFQTLQCFEGDQCLEGFEIIWRGCPDLPECLKGLRGFENVSKPFKPLKPFKHFGSSGRPPPEIVKTFQTLQCFEHILENYREWFPGFPEMFERCLKGFENVSKPFKHCNVLRVFSKIAGFEMFENSQNLANIAMT